MNGQKELHRQIAGTLSGTSGMCAVLSSSAVSNSLQPHGFQATRLLCPWDSPGQNTGVGCHFLLQLITYDHLLITSPCYSSELCVQMDTSFLFSFAFHFSSFFSFMEGLLRQAFCLFFFLHFFFLGMVLITAFYTMSRTPIYSSSGTLSDLIP